MVVLKGVPLRPRHDIFSGIDVHDNPIGIDLSCKSVLISVSQLFEIAFNQIVAFTLDVLDKLLCVWLVSDALKELDPLFSF